MRKRKLWIFGRNCLEFKRQLCQEPLANFVLFNSWTLQRLLWWKKTSQNKVLFFYIFVLPSLLKTVLKRRQSASKDSDFHSKLTFSTLIFRYFAQIIWIITKVSNFSWVILLHNLLWPKTVTQNTMNDLCNIFLDKTYKTSRKKTCNLCVL